MRVRIEPVGTVTTEANELGSARTTAKPNSDMRGSGVDWWA
jgi:hypothetical protein